MIYATQQPAKDSGFMVGTEGWPLCEFLEFKTQEDLKAYQQYIFEPGNFNTHNAIEQSYHPRVAKWTTGRKKKCVFTSEAGERIEFYQLQMWLRDPVYDIGTGLPEGEFIFGDDRDLTDHLYEGYYEDDFE